MLVLLFVFIVVFLFYNAKLMEKLKSTLIKSSVEQKACSCPEEECLPDCPERVVTEKTPLIPAKQQKPFSIQCSQSFKDMSYEVIDMSMQENNNLTTEIKLDDEASASCASIMFRVMVAPVRFLMYITLPQPTKTWFALTFVMSIAWLALLSYFTVDAIEYISKLAYLPVY